MSRSFFLARGRLCYFYRFQNGWDFKDIANSFDCGFPKICDGSLFHPFRHSPFIQLSTLVKIGLRKEKRCSPTGKHSLSGNDNKERTEMSNNNNQLNIPQAKEAMNKFKMQAASDEDVLFTS